MEKKYEESKETAIFFSWRFFAAACHKRMLESQTRAAAERVRERERERERERDMRRG